VKKLGHSHRQDQSEIDDLFGKLSYTSVSNPLSWGKVNTRFSEKLEKDRKIRRGVQKIVRELSQVKAPLHMPLHIG